jgi:hypothetical protein
LPRQRDTPKEYSKWIVPRDILYFYQNSSNCFTTDYLSCFLAKIDALKNSSFSYVFHPIFIPAMAALFYLFFTDSEFTSQEKLFVFFNCGGNGAIAFVGFFLLLKTAGTIDSIMLAKASQRKFRY